MSEEFSNASCSPSDCASCSAGCSSRMDESHNTISLTLEDDTEVECAILTRLTKKNISPFFLWTKTARIRMEKCISTLSPAQKPVTPCSPISRTMRNMMRQRKLSRQLWKMQKKQKKRLRNKIRSFFLPCFQQHLCMFLCHLPLFRSASKATVAHSSGIVIYRNPIFHKNSLHKSGSGRNLHCFSLPAVICQLYKYMAFIV